MSGEECDCTGTELRDRILSGLAAAVSAECFDTWFRPLGVVYIDRNVLRVTVPNETFRTTLTGRYAGLLRETSEQVTGVAGLELSISVEQGPHAEPGGAANSRAEPLPVVRAAALEVPARRGTWLIEYLWTHQAVGVIGGYPKSGKTWLALEIAVSVAAGSPCLGAFPVHTPGPVLLYAAEDSAADLRARLETISRVRGVSFEQLDVRVITADSLRLDRLEDQDRLEATLALHRPALLILDPLVRVHAIDENLAGQVAALLGYLRSLQRTNGAAIALVHHVRKNASPTSGAGNNLRGSGDLYAWLDSFLYLRKHQGQLTLSSEHRSAPPFGPVALDLVPSDGNTHLRVVTNPVLVPTPVQDSLADRVIGLLSGSAEPLTVEALRTQLKVRNQKVVETLRQLSTEGKVHRLARGYAIPSFPNQPLQVSL
jgi:hypothetical protein